MHRHSSAAISQGFRDIADASGRLQLRLPTVLGDDDLVHGLSASRGTLSRTRHHHAYDLRADRGRAWLWLRPFERFVVDICNGGGLT